MINDEAVVRRWLTCDCGKRHTAAGVWPATVCDMRTTPVRARIRRFGSSSVAGCSEGDPTMSPETVQCPGDCEDDCLLCGSGNWAEACDDCRFYMAQDAEIVDPVQP